MDINELIRRIVSLQKINVYTSTYCEFNLSEVDIYLLQSVIKRQFTKLPFVIIFWWYLACQIFYVI